MAYELNKKIVIDTEEYNNYAVGITLPIQRGADGYFAQSFRTFDQVRSNLKNLLLTKKVKEYYNLNLEVGYMIYCSNQLQKNLKRIWRLQ